MVTTSSITIYICVCVCADISDNVKTMLETYTYILREGFPSWCLNFDFGNFRDKVTLSCSVIKRKAVLN